MPLHCTFSLFCHLNLLKAYKKNAPYNFQNHLCLSLDWKKDEKDISFLSSSVQVLGRKGDFKPSVSRNNATLNCVANLPITYQKMKIRWGPCNFVTLRKVHLCEKIELDMIMIYMTTQTQSDTSFQVPLPKRHLWTHSYEGIKALFCPRSVNTKGNGRRMKLAYKIASEAM